MLIKTEEQVWDFLQGKAVLQSCAWMITFNPGKNIFLNGYNLLFFLENSTWKRGILYIPN